MPCAVWVGGGTCIAAAAAHGGIYFFHAGTAKVRHGSKLHCLTLKVCSLDVQRVVMQALHHIVPHPGNNVRSLDYDRDTDRLATSSFDKTVKIFRPEVSSDAATMDR